MIRAVLGMVFLIVTAWAVQGSSNPNIIVIYADDVGYGDIGCYGAEVIDTPNLDALAARGRRFTSAYATASTCTPSRYSLLTGEYPVRNQKAQILPGNAALIIDPVKPTIPSLLKTAGYTTALVGKWHLGLGLPTEPLDWNGEITPGPAQLGFDYSFHMAATGDRVPTVFIENGRIVGLDQEDPVQVSYEEPVGNEPTGLSHPHLLKTPADEQHAKTIVDGTSRIGWMSGGKSARWTDEEMPDTFLRKAIDFIETNKENRFFLFYAMHENHVPRLPHPRFRGATPLGVRGDAVVQLDWSVGQVVETLRANGLLEDTLIVFSSDNGPVLFDGYYDGGLERNGDHRPAGPWRGGKYSAWEGGGRMPFIISWPGTIEPGLSDAIISQVDLLASFSALTGVSVPEGFAADSENLINLLTGVSDQGREHVVIQGMTIKSIRKGDWKYIPKGEVADRGGVDEWIRTPTGPQGALFYLPEDPEERNNLARKYPAKARELRELLQAELEGSAMTDAHNTAGGAIKH